MSRGGAGLPPRPRGGLGPTPAGLRHESIRCGVAEANPSAVWQTRDVAKVSEIRETIPYEDLPFLERAGIEYLKRMSRGLPSADDDDPVHELDDKERAKVLAIERAGIIRSASAGAISALIAAFGVLWADHAYALGDEATTGELVKYWLVALGPGAIAAVFELVYLYRDGLRTVLKMARAAGLPLFDEADERVDRELAGSLARAALELPNPAEKTLGIDPLREASRWRLFLYSALYKGKVAVTTFLLKMLLRRAMGRVALRGAIEFVAVPVTAIWNGVVTARVLKEARLRILGPSAASGLLEGLWSDDPSSPQRAGAIRAVASAIVRSTDLHPNLVALLYEVRSRTTDGDEVPGIDDTSAFIEAFRAADADERRWLHAVATLAAVLDGKIVESERELLRELRRIIGIPTSLGDVDDLALRFRRGRRIEASELMPPTG